MNVLCKIRTLQLSSLKAYFLLFSLLFSTIFLFSQSDFGRNTKIIDKIRGEEITVDRFGNIYIIQESILYKCNMEGALLYTYSNFLLGSISTVDVDNSMKIMLYYQESATLLFLDDRLAPISEPINLMDRNFTSLSLATYSANNQICIYDFVNMDLIFLDMYFKPISKTHYNFPNFRPTQLMEMPGKMFAMHNPNDGLYLFDSFGTYIKKIGVVSDSKLQISNNIIYYLKEGKLHAFNYQELKDNVIDLKQDNIKQCVVYRNNIILLNQKGEVIIREVK